MVQSIARQSVVIKCNLQASIMTGNYEFYYGAGLLHQWMGVNLAEIPAPFELMEQVQEDIKSYQPKDEKEEHLIKMLTYYKPIENFDDQMKALYQEGKAEKRMWME